MRYSIIDIIIVLLLIICFVKGYKRGVVKQGVMTVGSLLVIILAFIFKNPLSMVMYTKLPFFTTGLLRNYSILNILLYELLSFLILLTIFGLIYAVLVKISGIIEKVLRGTIILALPSKLLGALLGVIENYIFCFIILLIITLPIFSFSNSKFITSSKLKDFILTKSVLLSSVSNDITKSALDINELINNEQKLGTEEFDCKALKVFIKNKIVSEESANYLIEHNKVKKTCTLD